jgi:hypothetical protein
MGWLRKKAKQIGKAIKKVGKKIKNVIGKIAKPFAKLGIVGQVALGFLMPWAAGAVWQGLTGTTFSLANFGTVAGNLAKSTNIFQSVAGKVMQGIHWGATTVQGAYNSITGAISDGFNNLTGKAKELFGMDADASDLIKNAPDVKVQMSPVETKDMGEYFKKKAAGLPTDVVEDVAEKTLFEQVKEKGKEAILDIPSKLVTGAVSGVGKGIAASIAQPDVEYSPEVADFLSSGAMTGYTKYNEVDFSKLNQYNDQIGSQSGIYGNPLHTVQTMTDNSFGLNTFEYWTGAR